MKRILLLTTTLGLALITATPAPAHAQDAWVRQVRQLVSQAGQAFEARGYELTHRIYTGSLNDGAAELVQLELDVGMEYQIMGACDEDCSDLDFTLYDGAGNEIDSDMLDDDFPVVSVTVSRSGVFAVRVSMADCSAEPCRYGIGIFGR
ncbi:MAG TPA: hypothetical protein VEQ60_06625 [Longimicrobium sp.]|nr:hypothetical protein [Longimicrobium sp.]